MAPAANAGLEINDTEAKEKSPKYHGKLRDLSSILIVCTGKAGGRSDTLNYWFEAVKSPE